MNGVNINGKNLRIINLYWHHTAAMKVGMDVGEFVTIKKEVRHGCVFFCQIYSI